MADLYVHYVSFRGLSRLLAQLGCGVGAATLWWDVQAVAPGLAPDPQTKLPPWSRWTRPGCPSGASSAPEAVVLGRRMCREPDLHYPSRLGKDLGLLTQGGEPRKLAVPDPVVMPPSWTLTEARERTVDERIICMDENDPAPELVVEVVSRSTEAKDFEDNLSL